MKNFEPKHRVESAPGAFTLIEILVVIAIIGILVALILPVAGGMNRKAKLKLAQAELGQVKAAIDAYREFHNFYPPDNPANPAINQLFFELQGVTLKNLNGQDVYVTLDGSSRMAVSDLSTVFGASVGGFMNYPKSTPTSDDETAAMTVLKHVRPNQIGQLVIGAQPAGNALLVCSVHGSDDPASQVVPTAGNLHALESGLNPWRYVSSKPTHNPNSYDLWVDVPIGGKTYRVSNWSTQPEVF
jgi:prepilin-type N-terminal cleavage/methylation domain-containing protein